MKNILFALLWAVTILPVSAQKTLPLSLQPYAKNLNPQITEALLKVGFDLGNNSGKVLNSPVADDRSGELQLDSTKTFYGYDFIGFNDSIPNVRTIYQYPEAKHSIQIESQFEEDIWITLSRSNVYTDDQGRMVEILSEAFDAELNDFVPDSRAVIFPHGDSPALIDSMHVYGWDSLAMDWQLIFYVLNSYDAQDRLVISISSFDYLGQPLLFKDVHVYDANGDNTLIESFTVLGPVELPTGKQELTYQNHLLTESVVFGQDGLGGLTAQQKVTYTYTSLDLQEQVNTYLWSLDENDWVQVQGDTYTYDNAQRVIVHETITYEQDGTEERVQARYEYEEAELLALQSNYYWSGNQFYLSDREFYYYSDGTLASKVPIAALPLMLSPNPTSGFVQLNLDSDAIVQIFTAQGELLHSGEYQAQKALNVSDLPTGLYFISAQSKNEQYVGRLVKE
jgi:hypothetical protein